MLMPLVSSALLLIASDGDDLKPGETRSVASDATRPNSGGPAPLERAQVDGIWTAGPCRVSAPLPAGYPAPTAPGAIELKAYPVIRKAQATALLGPEIGRNLAFWKLFRHIQSHEIAMTAPVEMRLDPKADDARELAGWSMAFLYREPTLGRLGADGEVTVVEEAPVTVISIGVKGDYTTERALAEAETLRTEVAKLKGWRAAGSPRVLFYNGPDTRTENRWSEVQIPLERVAAPKPATAAKRKHRVI